MQYLASLEENTEASRTVPSSALIAHDVIPCDGAYESDGGAPYFCSPLLMPSPSLSNDVPNIPPLDSSHSEGPAASLLFQPSRSTFPTTSPDINYYPVTLGHCNSNPPPSDACAQSFEAIVYTLADEALSLAQSVKSIFRAVNSILITMIYLHRIPSRNKHIKEFSKTGFPCLEMQGRL